MQINPRVHAEALSRAYGSDCWLGSNVNMAGATPAYGTMEGGRCFLPQNFTCSTRGFSNTSPFDSSVGSELMRRRRGATLLTKLSHQGPFIRNSARLLFLLLTASVFFLWIPGFSAHSCFSSAPLFSLLKRCFCKMPIRY